MRGRIRPLTMDNALRQSEEKHLEWHTVNRILDTVLNALRQSVGK